MSNLDINITLNPEDGKAITADGSSKSEIVSQEVSNKSDGLVKINGVSNTSTNNSEQNNEEVKSSGLAKAGFEKKGENCISFYQVFDDDYVFEILIDYFSLNQIYKLFYSLNKYYQEKVESANYLLLRKLIDKLNISSSYLTSDLPWRERIVNVYKSALKKIEEAKPVDLKPNAFTTDAGLIGTNMWYGMHNIFEVANSMYSYYVFSSNKGENNHIQAYLCNPGTYDSQFSQKTKSEFEKEPGSKTIYVPYEKTPLDGSMPTFKIPKVFEMNCRNQGYWYYADNIALFFCESELENYKCWEVEDYEKLPILSKDDSEKGFTITEYDLSKKTELLKTVGANIKRKNKTMLDVVPLIHIKIDKNLAYGKTLKYEIKQNVAAKYMVMKLICWASYPSQSQLDMFPCSLKGISLDF